MNKLLHNKSFLIVVVAILILIAIISLIKIFKNAETELITAEVTRGSVEYVVSVSGIVEGDNTAELAFPVSGKIAEVLVSEGDTVKQGQTLAYLERSALIAERQSAYASLLIAEANRDELINGPSVEERIVTNTNIKIAEENLVRTIAEQSEKVVNARRTLLSSSLEALPVKSDNDDAPPSISGTYTCEAGTHTISIYSSGSSSGHSFRLSGMGGGTYTAYSESSAPFGDCGLSIQFADGEIYASQDWAIAIPNTRSSIYAVNLNTYNLSVQLQINTVAAAKQALELALNEQMLENTTPRDEVLQRANASVIKAEANLAIINAGIQDRTLTAPFAGLVTDVDILPGETATTEPIITILADDLFKVTARIPEIDITKINVGQSANIVFDANVDEILLSKIVFISPLATKIDGVSYFEATIRIDETPDWIRGGLNSDIDIIIDSKNDILRIPKRFVIEDDDKTSVMLLHNKELIDVQIEVGFSGNDGFVEIIGLNEGDIVVAP